MVESRPRDRGDRRCDGTRNFPPCKALKTRKMRKEPRYCANPLCGPAERPAPMRKAWTTVADCGVPTAFTFWVGASVPPTTRPCRAVDSSDFHSGKAKPVVPCSMSLNHHTPFAAPGWLFRPPRRPRLGLRAGGEAKNLETDTLGLEPL